MSAPSNVQLARIGDEADIFDFFVLAQADNGFFPLSSKKVINMIMRAVRNDGATIGIIKGDNGIEAATGIMLECLWYTEHCFLSDLLTFVHPDHRRSGHSKALMKYQKDTSLYLSSKLGYNVPVIPAIFTRKRLEPKIRAFQREFQQIGAYFIFNGAELIKPSDEFMSQKKLEYPKHALPA